MKIGNINLKNNVLLAPMAGVTDLPFRLVENYVNLWKTIGWTKIKKGIAD